ncbi:MAG: pentapeptide repeat-containing protein, partial [Rhodobacteraceae bacterium]|nr:pentapeptide repeat-containing protein [Paracoccaceae bacterium]
RLERADLFWARLEGANLVGARLERADLVGARLEGADLVRARLEGANLVGAVFKSANWAEVTNDACPAQFADFRGVTDLDQARLSSLVGNAATLLPDTPPGLFVPHKWATEPPGFDLLLAEPSRYGFESADDLRAAFLCGPGEVPLKTGAPWPVDAAPPWGAQEAGEVEWDYLERIDAWAKAHPPTEPVP